MSIIKAVKFEGKGSFRGAIEYILGKDHAEGTVVYVNYQNIMDLSTAPEYMDAVARQYSGKSPLQPVWHCVCSFRADEDVTPEQADQAVKFILKNMKMNEAQAVWAIHKGDEIDSNPHIHLVVNKVSPDDYHVMKPNKGYGFYYDELQYAAAEVDRAQHRQSVKHGRWIVDEHGEIVRNKKTQKLKMPFSQRALDGEAHRGVKSLERIARERVGYILRMACSWSELHRELGMRGIRLERHGSGAVLKLDSDPKHVVKLSKVDRKGTLKNLQSRLGEWRPRDDEVEVANIPVVEESMTDAKAEMLDVPVPPRLATDEEIDKFLAFMLKHDLRLSSLGIPDISVLDSPYELAEKDLRAEREWADAEIEKRMAVIKAHEEHETQEMEQQKREQERLKMLERWQKFGVERKALELAKQMYEQEQLEREKLEKEQMELLERQREDEMKEQKQVVAVELQQEVTEVRNSQSDGWYPEVGSWAKFTPYNEKIAPIKGEIVDVSTEGAKLACHGVEFLLEYDKGVFSPALAPELKQKPKHGEQKISQVKEADRRKSQSKDSGWGL